MILAGEYRCQCNNWKSRSNPILLWSINFDKDIMTYHWRKNSIFDKCDKTGNPHEKENLDPYLMAYKTSTQNESMTSREKLQILGENIEVKLQDFGFGSGFL